MLLQSIAMSVQFDLGSADAHRFRLSHRGVVLSSAPKVVAIGTGSSWGENEREMAFVFGNRSALPLGTLAMG